MKVTTLQYNANQPMPQQIAVPTNSEYAIGLKIIRDGEPVELSASELSVGGQTCTAMNADYSVFKLSSDGFEGMKKLDVVVDKAGDNGLTSYFKLQVQQKDMGYIEVESIDSDDDIIVT